MQFLAGFGATNDDSDLTAAELSTVTASITAAQAGAAAKRNCQLADIYGWRNHLGVLQSYPYLFWLNASDSKVASPCDSEILVYAAAYFQKKHGLRLVDGKIGPETTAKLKALQPDADLTPAGAPTGGSGGVPTPQAPPPVSFGTPPAVPIAARVSDAAPKVFAATGIGLIAAAATMFLADLFAGKPKRRRGRR